MVFTKSFLRDRKLLFPPVITTHLCEWTWDRFSSVVIKFGCKQHYWVARTEKRCFTCSVVAPCSHSMTQIKGDKLRLGWGLGSWLISHFLYDVLNTASTCSRHLVLLPKCKGSRAHEPPLLRTDCAQWICRAAECGESERRIIPLPGHPGW